MSNIRNDLEELTTQILIENDMLYKAPVDVINISKNYGINVYSANLGKEISGAIRYEKEKDNFRIVVNENNAEVRQRFTVAHELGHYFLHRGMLKSTDTHIDTLYRTATRTNEETKEKEREVDYFAGVLLINKMIIEKMVSNYIIEELANIFGVSTSAMFVRLNILGLC